MKTALKEGEFIVGLDIGGTKMMACVFDHKFKVVGRCKKKSKSSKAEDPEERIERIVKEALADSGGKTIRGIGVGHRGRSTQKRWSSTRRAGWKKFPLGECSEAFGVPVAVDNDVNLGTYGEWVFGKIRTARTACFRARESAAASSSTDSSTTARRGRRVKWAT